MMVPLWLASTVLVAQAHAIVVVTGEAGTRLEETALDVNEVARAIAARLTGSDVDVVTVDDDSHERWTVSLAGAGSGALAVTIRAPDTRVVRQGTLSFRRRTPSDVASTVAIWAIEALTPVMPELAQQRPELVARPVRAEPVIDDSFPPPREHHAFAARLGLGAQYIMASERALGQLELAGLWRPGRRFGLLLGADVTTAFGAVRDGAELSVRRGALVLAGEMRWELSTMTLHAHLGPMLRGLRVDADGSDVAFEPRIYVDPGAQLSLGASVAASRAFAIGVAARFELYVAHPNLVVDGTANLDTGGAAAGLVVWLEPHW